MEDKELIVDIESVENNLQNMEEAKKRIKSARDNISSSSNNIDSRISGRFSYDYNAIEDILVQCITAADDVYCMSSDYIYETKKTIKILLRCPRRHQ